VRFPEPQIFFASEINLSNFSTSTTGDVLNEIPVSLFNATDAAMAFSEPGNSKVRNGDEITSPSRRIDLGQICSISNHKS